MTDFPSVKFLPCAPIPDVRRSRLTLLSFSPLPKSITILTQPAPRAQWREVAGSRVPWPTPRGSRPTRRMRIRSRPQPPPPARPRRQPQPRVSLLLLLPPLFLRRRRRGEDVIVGVIIPPVAAQPPAATAESASAGRESGAGGDHRGAGAPVTGRPPRGQAARHLAV